MLQSFEARACAVQELDDLNTFLIAFADQADAPLHTLELQRSLEVDEQDIALGMDTYCVVTETGAAYYGGIISCIVSEDEVALDFSAAATAVLGHEGYRIRLALPSAEYTALRLGLARLFADDRQAPTNLSI